MTKPIRAKISALGTYVPPRLLTNADLEKMVDTTNEWIMTRVGIRERHVVDKGVATSDLAVEAAKIALAQRGLAPTDIDAFIPHQANLRIISATADRLGLKPESVIVNIDRYGNTTAGTIPLAMNTAMQEGRLKKGSLVMLASVGAGFTIGATLLRWAF